MPEKLIWVIFHIALLLSFSSGSSAEIASENYLIRSSVHSAGGVPTGSANYKLNSTVGQPSPIMDSMDIPYSTHYDLYPGFWYTLLTALMPCEELFSFAQAFGTTNSDSDYNISCDSEPDGDIDGVDLADFLQGYGL